MYCRLQSASALALFLVSLSAVSTAGTITVTPADPNGWSWTGAHKSALAFANYGPAVDEGAGFLYGNGAFYAMCGESGNNVGETPGTVWLGLDQQEGVPLPGTPLDSIKTLKYSTYVSTWPTYRDNDRYPRWPRQPIQLQIQFVLSDGVTCRYVMHRPWGLVGDNQGLWVGQWENWNAVTCNSYNPNDVWYDTITYAVYNSWADVCAAYPGAVLAPTSTTWDPANGQWKSTGWDAKADPPGWPTASGTGKCINLEVGARKYATDVFGQPKDYAWWKEGFSFKGYVDNFTIGIDRNADGDDTDPGERTAYDFESTAPPQRKVAVTCGSCYEFDPGLMGRSFVDRSFRFKVCGVVVHPYGLPPITADEFYIWDGSYAWIYDKEEEAKVYQQAFVVVHAPGHNAQPGEVWSALGDIRSSLWLNQPYNYVWTNLADCRRMD